jgi:hypothetical protein
LLKKGARACLVTLAAYPLSELDLDPSEEKIPTNVFISHACFDLSMRESAHRIQVLILPFLFVWQFLLHTHHFNDFLFGTTILASFRIIARLIFRMKFSTAGIASASFVNAGGWKMLGIAAVDTK